MFSSICYYIFFGRQVEPPSNFDMYFFSLENPGLLFQSVLVDVEPTVDGEILHQLVDGYAIIIPFFTVFYSYQ